MDAAWAQAVEDSADADTSLRDALLRTAAQMEAQGISAPESVGPATAAEEVPTAPDDVDDDIRAWLTEAYERAARPSRRGRSE
mgnify:CR=1 FL=1